MLAWMIILTVILVAVIIFAVFAAKEICRIRTDLHNLLNFSPYAGVSYGRTLYRSNVIKEVQDTYDSTPEFVKGIKDMLVDIENLHKLPTYRTQHYTGTGIDERSFELLEERVNDIGDSVDLINNSRINELEKDLRALTERVKDVEDVLKEGKVD